MQKHKVEPFPVLKKLRSWSYLSSTGVLMPEVVLWLRWVGREEMAIFKVWNIVPRVSGVGWTVLYPPKSTAICSREGLASIWSCPWGNSQLGQGVSRRCPSGGRNGWCMVNQSKVPGLPNPTSSVVSFFPMRNAVSLPIFLPKVSFNYNLLYLEAFTFSLHLRHNCVLKHANTNHWRGLEDFPEVICFKWQSSLIPQQASNAEHLKADLQSTGRAIYFYALAVSNVPP